MAAELVHRLGIVLAVCAAALCAVGAVAAARRERAARQRLRGLLGLPPESSRVRVRPAFGEALRPWLPVAGVAVGAAVLVGGVPGCLVGAGAAYGIRQWQRRPRAAPGSAADRAEETRQLPLAADLMAACLAAGAGPREAADAVGRSLGGPLGDALTRIAAELRLGGDPAACWARLGSHDLGRCLERASSTGIPPVGEVSRLAAAYRAERTRAAVARARRAGVLATAPLGLCFLPAFLLVGVAPVVMGLAGSILAASN
ncbi:MAG: hypothetical protein QOF84_2439 [Streptomyces sp.]|jgi:pilus assembly protein TadC|nr:hypothetical protein [Streptomyces sp.]